MSTIEIFFLAILQGLTEFLPVSSSAHLILPSQLFGWKDQGLAFDVAVHVGTLLAVCLYFKDQVGTMAASWTKTFKGGVQDFDGKLAWWICFATIPAGLFGFFGRGFIEENFRTAIVISATTILFGVLLGFADIKAKEVKKIEDLGLKGSVFVGFAQVLALIPGTSRSGITMTMGMMLGLNKECAARFSFLLSIPLIAMAGSYLTMKLALSDVVVQWSEVALGSGIAFVAAYACIHYFLIMVTRIGMFPFVIYRLCLGFGLLWFVTV